METETGKLITETGKGTGLGFAAATLAILAITSTLAQCVSLVSLGHLDEVEPQMSTGGLLALLAAIVMWVKCPSWSYWKKWIWPWVGMVAVLAFVVSNVNVQAWQEETRIAEQRVIDEAMAEMQAAQACDELYDQIQVRESALYAQEHAVRDGAFDDFLRKYSRNGWVDSELQQLKDDYMRTC